MAISGSLNYEGLEITGSYTNINSINYTKNNNHYVVSYEYSLYINEEHKNKNTLPLKSIRTSYSVPLSGDSGSIDISNLFQFAYESVKTQPYYISSSLIDC